MISVLKPFSLNISHNRKDISEAIYLLIKDVIFPAYGFDNVLSALEKINTTLLKNKMNTPEGKEDRFDEVFESLLFMNYVLHIIKKNEASHPSITYYTLKLNEHIPSLDLVDAIISNFLKVKLEYEYSTIYEDKLPNLILHQTLWTFSFLIDKFKREEDK